MTSVIFILICLAVIGVLVWLDKRPVLDAAPEPSPPSDYWVVQPLQKFAVTALAGDTNALWFPGGALTIKNLDGFVSFDVKTDANLLGYAVTVNGREL